MTDEQNRETGSNPPPPPGGPPTPPAKGAGAPEPWLPPRLRDRLYGSEDEPPPKADNPMLGWLAMLVIAAMIGGLVYWRMQKSKVEAHEAAEKAKVERAAAVADSLDRLRIADSLRVVAREDSVRRFKALPPWKQKMILAGKDTSTTAPAAAGAGAGAAAGGGAAPAEEAGHWAIDAGSYLFEDAAQTALAKVKSGTKLTARVVPIEREGQTSYHIYVGDFRAKGEATHRANQLFEKGTVQQANVVKVEE